MTISTKEQSDGTGYCKGCGTTIGEQHHADCAQEIIIDSEALNELPNYINCIRPICCLPASSGRAHE